LRTGHHAAALATSASSSRASSRASSESSAKLEQRASSAGFGSDGRAGQGGDRHSSIRDLSAAARLEARRHPSASARGNDDDLQSYSYHHGGHGDESIFEAFHGGWSGGTTRGSSSFYSGRSGSSGGGRASGPGPAPSRAPSSNPSSRSRLWSASSAAASAAAVGTAASERLSSVNTNDASTLEERSGGRRY